VLFITDGQSKNVDVIVCIEFKNGRRRITTVNQAERFITGTLISGIPAGFCDVIVISCCSRDHVYRTSSLVTNSQVSGRWPGARRHKYRHQRRLFYYRPT